MHITLSGPYETLYTFGVDMWSFGCLCLNICIGKTAALRQREVTNKSVIVIWIGYISFCLKFSAYTMIFFLTQIYCQVQNSLHLYQVLSFLAALSVCACTYLSPFASACMKKCFK